MGSFALTPAGPAAAYTAEMKLPDNTTLTQQAARRAAPGLRAAPADEGPPRCACTVHTTAARAGALALLLAPRGSR